MKISLLRFAAVALAVTSHVHAQVTITETGTAQSTALGYVSGQSYTFIFTTVSNYAQNTHTNLGVVNTWFELVGDQQLFNMISGTSVTGSFTDPASDASSYLRAPSQVSNGLELVVSSVHLGLSLGLFTPDGSDISQIGGVQRGVTTFSAAPVYTDPEAYFSAYNGTYTPTFSTSSLSVYNLNGVTGVVFRITSLTISASAVPEPSTCAVLLGLTALGFAAYRRRRRQAG